MGMKWEEVAVGPLNTCTTTFHTALLQCYMRKVAFSLKQNFVV